MASWIPRVSDRKMCCGMRAARRRFCRLLPTRGLLEHLSWSCLLRTRKRSYLFPRVVKGMDGVWVIYVPAQTHLIYSPKHNSLTLFREKCSYILVTPRGLVRYLARYENANTDFPSLHPPKLAHTFFLFRQLFYPMATEDVSQVSDSFICLSYRFSPFCNDKFTLVLVSVHKVLLLYYAVSRVER